MFLWESENNFEFFLRNLISSWAPEFVDSNIITHMEILHLLTLESVVQMIIICLGLHYI